MLKETFSVVVCYLTQNYSLWRDLKRQAMPCPCFTAGWKELCQSWAMLI